MVEADQAELEGFIAGNLKVGESFPFGCTEEGEVAITIQDLEDPGFMSAFLPFRRMADGNHIWVRLYTCGWTGKRSDQPYLSYQMGPIRSIWHEEGYVSSLRVKSGLEFALALGLSDPDGKVIGIPEEGLDANAGVEAGEEN